MINQDLSNDFAKLFLRLHRSYSEKATAVSCAKGVPEDREKQVLALPGRVLGFAEYGEPTARAVFYFHGFPGSRLEGRVWEKHAKAEGVRLICLDRAGSGLSSYEADRRLIDYPNDVREVARHLGVRNYDVLGMSGGGPYALACARYLPPEELGSVALVNPLGPWHSGYMKMLFFQFFVVSRLGPFTRQFVHDKYVLPAFDPNPEALKKVLLSSKPQGPRQTEVSALKHWEPMLRDAIKEQFRTGGLGFIKEAQLQTRVFGTWGFKLKDVTFPRVHIWQTAEDTVIPAGSSRKMASQIPHAKYTEFPEGGHTSIVHDHGSRILRELTRGSQLESSEKIPSAKDS